MDQEIAIDNIKRLIQREEKQPIKLHSGDGISVSPSKDGYYISAFNQGEDQITSGSSSSKTYTLDICVNGSPKKLDVYVAGSPY
jgi:hypothetical protein